MNRPASHVLALLAATLLVLAPAARVRAQDDDMPDGDVDLVERPHKRAPPKHEAPKKDTRKKKHEDKSADKSAPPKPKKHEDNKPPPRDRDRDLEDDSDILAPPPPDEDKPKPPPKHEDKRPPPPEDKPADDSKSRVLHTVDAPVTPVVDDEPAAPPPRHAASDDGERRRGPLTSDDAAGSAVDDDIPEAPHHDRAGPLPSVADQRDRSLESPDHALEATDTSDRDSDVGRVKTVDEKLQEPDDGDDGGVGWIIAGATGGGLVLLAAAGVGGYFLVDALSPKNGTITVTAR